MTSPKDVRNAILGAGLARANSVPAEINPQPQENIHRVAAGAVGAVSRSLSKFDEQLRAAEKLISSGDHVVELSAQDVEPSFMRDRMESNEQSHQELVQSIREHGQQVPILVRPASNGMYQIAYGHRRFRACQSLGIPVRAVVRELTDDQLLIAQGQENSARADLSFIERALFAAMLEDRGSSRDVVMAALSTDKTELSKLLSVVRAIPRDLIEAIGPAPKVGRTRWMGLAEKLAVPETLKAVHSIAFSPELAQSPSDERFVRIFSAASARPKRKATAKVWTSPKGTRPVRIEEGPDQTVFTVSEAVAPAFGAFLIDQLPTLFEAYQARTNRDQN